MPGVTASLRSSSAGCVGVTEQEPVRVMAELLQNQMSPSEVLQRPASPCHTNTLKSYIQTREQLHVQQYFKYISNLKIYTTGASKKIRISWKSFFFL